MRKIHCINAISKYGTDQFTEDYQLTDEVNEAEGILVRSASLHEMQFSNSLLAIARAGAGVNNIPLDACAQEGIVAVSSGAKRIKRTQTLPNRQRRQRRPLPAARSRARSLVW